MENTAIIARLLAIFNLVLAGILAVGDIIVTAVQSAVDFCFCGNNGYAGSGVKTAAMFPRIIVVVLALLVLPGIGIVQTANVAQAQNHSVVPGGENFWNRSDWDNLGFPGNALDDLREDPLNFYNPNSPGYFEKIVINLSVNGQTDDFPGFDFPGFVGAENDAQKIFFVLTGGNGAANSQLLEVIGSLKTEVDENHEQAEKDIANLNKDIDKLDGVIKSRGKDLMRQVDEIKTMLRNAMVGFIVMLIGMIGWLLKRLLSRPSTNRS